jgi:lipopolysaccharide export system permease protein
MSILFRYLSVQILASVGLTLVGLILLFGFFDFIDELGDTRQEGYTVGLAMLHVALRLPSIAHESLPIAALVGALIALARLAIGSEFTVMRASGLSTRRLAGYAVVLGIFLGLATLALGEFVAPPAERLAKQVKLRSMGKLVAQEFRSGLWAKDGKAFINIRQMLPDTSLRGIRMYVFDEDFNLQKVLQAEQGAWSQEGHWHLQGVNETTLGPEGTRTLTMAETNWQTNVTPDLLSALMVRPERMALTTLYAYVSHLRENQQKATLYEIALWNKLAAPLAVPVMLLLALPFAYYRPRSQNVGAQVLLGILIGLGFHLLNRLSGNIGLINDWPPAVSALLPLALFSVAALIALKRVELR